MLLEAELFVMTEDMLVEVLGRIRDDDREIVLPVMVGTPGTDPTTWMWEALEQHAEDDARVPGVLNRRSRDAGDDHRSGRELLGEDPMGQIALLAGAASEAAHAAVDGDAPVTSPFGDVSTRDYLLQLTLARCFLAHYIAAYLGSTACPLPEELARPLWELTAPDAETWRSRGFFRAPMPLPDHVSWRDRFLLSAGHQPHP
uniref:hypothetical protein n=1 Tax=Lapillicoccus sp. TaxID=1909287 RepID=UPI0039838733